MVYRFVMILLFVPMMLMFWGCGDKDCTSLCEEAQAGNCTAISGNCGDFCSSVEAVRGPSGCGTQQDDYESCLNSTGDVCEAGCGSQENAYGNCLVPYCLANASDSNCMTIIAALQ